MARTRANLYASPWKRARRERSGPFCFVESSPRVWFSFVSEIKVNA